ncbi:hypothetical protein DPMN_108841 [Dreissena polymorpha]|uniref:Uncharacterized protein n=1 Tax=Dreissena polymorpha TaxID=45954 RepID=A0A9D4K980_DREPO|nr:hypothetical protein DPMN_108841 [Dreissena polymorpha]
MHHRFTLSVYAQLKNTVRVTGSASMSPSWSSLAVASTAKLRTRNAMFNNRAATANSGRRCEVDMMSA